MPALTVTQIANLCSGTFEGDGERWLSGANTIENASSDDLSFAANQKAVEAALSSQAGCIIVSPSFSASGSWSLVRTADPRRAFARAIAHMFPTEELPPSIHPTAIIHPEARIAATCHIGAYVTIGSGTSIAGGCVIGNGCHIGREVWLDEGAILKPHVTIYDRVRIGQRTLVHSGCIIGADGFGFALAGERYEKFPQIGTVEIGDDVEIGANCCIDRAALGVTRIGDGTKLDNLVHVAHNCDIGRHVVIAAQTGFSGSVTVGDYAVFGGQVGIGEKAKISARAVVGGKSGILTGQTVSGGEPVWGIPARPLRQHLKGLASVARLPKWREELDQIRSRIAALETSESERPE